MQPTDGKTESGQDISVFDAPDLTPEEMTKHTAGIIANALEETGLIEVREVQVNMVNQVHLLARVQAKHASTVAQKVVDTLLIRTDDDPEIDAFFGKQYIRKMDEETKRKKLAFAWVFSFASKDLRYMAQVVCDAIEEAVPRKKLDVLEAPLLGPGTPQSTGPGSKGARPVRG
jgi:hypothetical protein